MSGGAVALAVLVFAAVLVLPAIAADAREALRQARHRERP